MKSAYDYLLDSAELFPGKCAVAYSKRHITYSELVKNVDALAAGMEKSGIGEGTVVAMLMRNCVDLVECFYALWKLGAVAAPLNFRENADGVRLMLKIAKAEFLICDSARIEELGLADAGIKFIAVDSGYDGPTLDKLKLCGTSHSRPHLSDDAEMLYVFTSGTTGAPKATVHTKGSLSEFSLYCFEFGGLYSRDDVFLSYSPLFHIGGMRILISCLMCGATLVLTSTFDPAEIVDIITRERVTQMLVIPPSIVLRLKDIADRASKSLPSIKRIRVSGGLCTEQAVETLLSYFGKATLINGYGSSESAISTFNIINRDEYTEHPGIIKSIGRPLPGCEIQLRDDNGCVIKKPHVVGEAFGRCGYKFKRYQTLYGVEYPDTWFDTGDRLYFDDDGNYYFAGREKDIIKTGGENVFAGEVEAVIQQMPVVSECAVFKTPHEILGEAVSAAIVLKSGCTCTGKDVVEFCRKNMASYKKPVKVFFLEQLPKTASGKVRKVELEDMAAKGALDDRRRLQ